MEIKPSEITQFQASGTLAVKDFLQTVCTTARLDASSHVFVYPETAEIILPDTPVQDLKVCAVKLVKTKGRSFFVRAVTKREFILWCDRSFLEFRFLIFMFSYHSRSIDWKESAFSYKSVYFFLLLESEF